MKRRIVLVVLVLLATITPAVAQITTATISGTIKDETGGVLPGVDVVVRNLETGLTRNTVSDSQGYFAVPGLAPGRYEARASLQGFATGVQSGIVLAVAQQAALTLTLKVGTASETITVSGESPLVEVRTSALSAVVTEKTIEELPLNGRNYITLATLQPGIVQFTEKSGTASATRGVQLNINGMGGRSNSYLMDGANMKGYAGLATVTAADSTLGVETIREFRVVTNSFSADYGRAMGGIINIATKSGSNELHGSAFEFFRNSRMDAPNYFDVGDPPPFTRHQYGSVVGGPLRKNKIFFFGGYERLQEDLGQTVVTAVPTAAARAGVVSPLVRPYLDLYPLPNGRDLGAGIGQYNYAFSRVTRENFLQGRVDIDLSNKDVLFVRHTYDGAKQIYPLATGVIGTSGFPQFFTNGISTNQFFTVEENRTFTPSFLNAARFSTSVLKWEQTPGNTLNNPLPFFDGAPLMGAIDVGGLSRLGNDNTLPSTNNITYWTWSDDVTLTRGKHLLKTGGLIEHALSSKMTTVNSRGTYNFASLTTFLTGTPSRFQGIVPGSNLVRDRPNTLFGFYVQDDYRVTSALTLNLGARYEFFTVPSSKGGLDVHLDDLLKSTTTTVGKPFLNPSLGNIAPRLGFAWDLTGDGRTAIRGGSGLYYDTDNPYNSSLGLTASNPPFGGVVNLTGASIPFPTPVFPTGAAGGALALRLVDYNIKQPYGWTYNVNLQRELVNDWGLMVGYAGSRGYHLVSSIEGNPVIPTIQPDGSMFFPAGAPRRNPAWSSVDYRTSNGRSEYNSLQTSLMKRYSRGYQVQLSYTLSRAKDNNDSQLGNDSQTSSTYPPNPYNVDAEWAPSIFDVTHVFAANATWELPSWRNNMALAGWQVNAVVSLRTGYPFSPSIATSNWSRSGNTAGNTEDRPNVKAGTDPKRIITGDPNHWFDTSVFELQPQGTFGNTPRNFLRGPGFANVDLSVVKNQALAGATKIQLRLEVFNLLNRANFAVPTRAVFAGATQNEVPLATAGQVTRTANTSRQVQLGIKVVY